MTNLISRIMQLQSEVPTLVTYSPTTPKLWSRFEKNHRIIWCTTKSMDRQLGLFYQTFNGLKLFNVNFYPCNITENKLGLSLKDFIFWFNKHNIDKSKFMLMGYKPFATLLSDANITVGYIENLTDAANNCYIGCSIGYPVVEQFEFIGSSFSTFLCAYLNFIEDNQYNIDTFPDLQYFIDADVVLKNAYNKSIVFNHKNKMLPLI